MRYLYQAGLVLFLLLASGCERKSVELSTQSQSPLPSGSSGYLRLPINGAITTLDPGLSEDIFSVELTEQLFLALTGFDPLTYKVVAELATHWQVYDQGLRYRFYLRKDAFWSDGKAVTAEDIVWAIQRNIAPQTQAPYASALYVLAHAEALHLGHMTDFSRLGVRAIDQWTVEFQLRSPVSHFPTLVSLPVYRPLPRQAVDTWGQHWTLPGRLVSNGAYQLADWQKNQHLTLRKNPYYFNADQVSIEEVRYLTIVDSALGLRLYRHNELDVIGGLYLPLPLHELINLRRDPALRGQFRQQPTLCSDTYAFNLSRAPTDDVRVRRAIAAVINRSLLVETFMRGAAQPSSAYVSPNPEITDAAVGITFDPGQARVWLQEAGYPDGKDFPPLTLAYNASQTHRTVAQATQKFLSHYLGITLTLQELPWRKYLQAIEQPHTPHLFRFGWCADYPDPYSWLSGVTQPVTAIQRIGWADTAFTRQLEHILSLSDPAERQQRYRQLEYQLLNEQAVLLPLYFKTTLYLVKPWVQEWYAMPFGGQSIQDWGLAD